MESQKYKNWSEYFAAQIWTADDSTPNKSSIDASWKNESNELSPERLPQIV